MRAGCGVSLLGHKENEMIRCGAFIAAANCPWARSIACAPLWS